jgi:hypothetical protein
MGEDPECAFSLSIHLLNYSMVTPLIMIRVGFVTQPKHTTHVPAKLLKTLHRFSAHIHAIPFIEMSPASFDRTIDMCDLFPEQAGSAIAEPALSPIVYLQ